MGGLTTTGFDIETLQDILAANQADLQGTFGQGINLNPNSRFGQLSGIFSQPVSDLWELAQAIVASLDPDQAQGAQLDSLCAITGTLRHQATFSTDVETLVGTNGTVVPQGNQFQVSGNGPVFATTAPATIATATAWVHSTPYSVGQTVSNAGNLYRCIISGTSAGSGGPTTTGSAITDGSVTWKYIAAGSAFVDVNVQALNTGPLVALSGTLTVIKSPVAGLTTATNLFDALEGQNLENDAALRLRRETELRGKGLGTLDAMLAAVTDVTGVLQAAVFENTTMATDVNGVPPKAVQAVVQGGTDLDVATAVFNSKPAGIQSYGTTTVSVTDPTTGVVYSISFSRPTVVPVYVIANVKKTVGWPTDGSGPSQVTTQILQYGIDKLLLGADVVSSAMGVYVFKVSGVGDVTCLIGLAPSPSSTTTLVATSRQLMQLDSSRITVNVSSFP